ncbi:mannitol dehydrogenase family protein (plasmid) [Rhizobium sp. 32-5/1]|uniref:mannitol dehydrogenase family protein n=1 Tax=Rhizobium sp. 32-5/1 TaxID=3019602 RepID=UPI00240E0807|nr:mannitol dehydrogenase family protein [Rhizobium sp. 32-5/1]WEZ85310.1 mannitol dehydrogenase family protein [Rhizobium sp. 32-5/1]
MRRLVTEMASIRDEALAGWISDRAAFPSTMVDRIVPAATTGTRQRAAHLLNAEDMLALDTEPFMQWVVEDDFPSGRPAWELGGALIVQTVQPYEKMKLRMLNGAHSMIAYIGQINGFQHVRDVMAVPSHRSLVERYMLAAAQTLDPVPGVDLQSYGEQLLTRFANPTIAHETRQIAMDGSQKLPQRTFLAAVDDLAAGRSGEIFAYATAAWIAYLLQAMDLEDPRRDELLAAAAKVAEGGNLNPIFSIAGLFPPPLLERKDWLDLVGMGLTEIRASGYLIPDIE